MTGIQGSSPLASTEWDGARTASLTEWSTGRALARLRRRPASTSINETNPTCENFLYILKRGLGDYCFVIEFEGRVADDVVADCLADLQARLARVKFLGSYPATGEPAADRREELAEARKSAKSWIQTIRARILSS
jgi:hypothetical protein